MNTIHDSYRKIAKNAEKKLTKLKSELSSAEMGTKELERQHLSRDDYFDPKQIYAEVDDLRYVKNKKITPWENVILLWTNILKEMTQNALMNAQIRKKIFERMVTKRNVKCPPKNIIFGSSVISDTVKKIKKIIKPGSKTAKSFCIVTPKDESDAAHYIGFHQHGNKVMCLDPAVGEQSRDWGHLEWVKEVKKKMELEGFQFEYYLPKERCQFLEIDTWCQSWSLYLQINAANDTLNNQSFTLKNDLFPFLVSVFSILEKGISRKVSTELAYDLYFPNKNIKDETIDSGNFFRDMELFYYTFVTKIKTSELLTLLTPDNVAKTILWKIPPLGTFMDLDENEKQFVETSIAQLEMDDMYFLFEKIKRRFLFLEQNALKERQKLKGGASKTKTLRHYNPKKIYTAKNGRKYIKNKLGQTRFIK